jgi:hypothetical protein
MPDVHKQLARQLKRLNGTIQRLVARSKEFGELRHLLRSGQVQLAIYVVPVIGGQPMVTQEMRCELTEEDRAFLKQAGLTFGETTGASG